MNIKIYLLSRLTSMAAWIGIIGFLAEILLHLGNVSTLMLMLFVLLIVLPEDTIRAQFTEWAAQVRTWANDD